MGVGTMGHRLTIGDNGAERGEMPELFLGGARIEEGVELGVEAGLRGQQIAQEKVINGRLMAQMPANTTTLWRWTPLHVGFREIGIQTVRIAPRLIVLVTKHLEVHSFPMAPMRTQKS